MKDKLEENITVLECQDCQSIIQSDYGHHFVKCRCLKCFIDGGRNYTRYGWTDTIPILYSLDLETGVLTKKKE